MNDEKSFVVCPECGAHLDPDSIHDPIEEHCGAYRLERSYGFFGERDFVIVDIDAPVADGDIIAVQKGDCNLIVRYVNVKRHNNTPTDYYALYPIFGEPFELDESVRILGKVISIATNILGGEFL